VAPAKGHFTGKASLARNRQHPVIECPVWGGGRRGVRTGTKEKRGRGCFRLREWSSPECFAGASVRPVRGWAFGGRLGKGNDFLS